MTRRNVLKLIIFLGGSTLLSLYIFKPFRLILSPDFNVLEQEKETLDELVETILPVTDSPGAKEVNAGDFVIRSVKNCLDRRSQNNFISGFSDFVDYCTGLSGGSFINCSVKERINALKHFESREFDHKGLMGKVKVKILGHGFISTLKKYTVIGYCTSQLGATQGLQYDFIPGVYTGIISLKADQKGWATR